MFARDCPFATGIAESRRWGYGEARLCGVFASDCEGTSRAVVCITNNLAACCQEWPDAIRYCSLYQYSCHVVSGDLDMLTLYGIAHALGVAIIVIHDTDRSDWRIWHWFIGGVQVPK